MKKGWMLCNQYSPVGGFGEKFVLGVFSDLAKAKKELKRFCRAANCTWQEDGENSYIRVRKTKFRESGDEYAFLEECTLDSVSKELWAFRTNPKDNDGQEENV